MNATNISNTHKIADRDLRIELDNMEKEDLRARAVMIIEENNLERQERKIIIDNQKGRILILNKEIDKIEGELVEKGQLMKEYR